jgi:hypothetical protein
MCPLLPPTQQKVGYFSSWQLYLFTLLLTVFPQLRSFQGQTALLHAVGYGDVATVQVLVAAKANLEAKDRDVGLSFLSERPSCRGCRSAGLWKLLARISVVAGLAYLCVLTVIRAIRHGLR